ncbi:hypothetical protein Tco_1270186 [Tanacetum coccineum]
MGRLYVSRDAPMGRLYYGERFIHVFLDFTIGRLYGKTFMGRLYVSSDSIKSSNLMGECPTQDSLKLSSIISSLKIKLDKKTGINERTGTKPGVPDVPKDQSESENESWGNSKDDDSNDDDSDDVTNDDDDDDIDSDVDGDNEASDSEKTNSDEDDNPNLNQNGDEEEEYEEEYVCTPEFSDDEEEYEELYKDVNVLLKDAEHEEEGKEDAKMTDKTEVPLHSSSISSDFANQFLNLDNAPPVDNKVVSMMNFKVHHEEPSTQNLSLLTILVTSTPTPTPAPTTETTTTSIPTLPDISSLFGFDQRVSILERDLSQLKQVDYSAQLLETIKSQIPAMVDAQLSIRLEDSI